MSERYQEILKIYVDIIIKQGDYSVQGIESAFIEFCNSLKKHEIKPRVIAKDADETNYVKTTLAEAIQRARLPVHITVQRNKHGNLESTVYPGLIFKEVNGANICVGFQDGEKIAPLSMNQVRICQANGYRFDVTNTVGSAKTVDSELAIKIEV
jgi:hypothetical protein